MFCGHIEKIISGAMDIFLFYMTSYARAKAAHRKVGITKNPEKKLLITQRNTE